MLEQAREESEAMAAMEEDVDEGFVGDRAAKDEDDEKHGMQSNHLRTPQLVLPTRTDGAHARASANRTTETPTNNADALAPGTPKLRRQKSSRFN